MGNILVDTVDERQYNYITNVIPSCLTNYAENIKNSKTKSEQQFYINRFIVQLKDFNKGVESELSKSNNIEIDGVRCIGGNNQEINLEVYASNNGIGGLELYNFLKSINAIIKPLPLSRECYINRIQYIKYFENYNPNKENIVYLAELTANQYKQLEKFLDKLNKTR